MKKWKSTVNVLLFNFGAVLIGLVISALLLYFMKVNPAAIIGQTLGKIFGDKYNMGEILVKATPLIFTSLAFAFTFKANLFNIGAQGQFYMGSIVAVAISLALGDVLPLYEDLNSAAVDPYIAMREAYINFRNSQVKH